MDLERGQGEWVERQDVLRVLRLAVRPDHLAVHDHPRDLDNKRAGGQVEEVTASARQFAASHARGGFEYPQRKESVGPRALQEGLELSDGPDFAAFAGDTGRVCVAAENEVTLFNPATVTVTRYRWRASIPSPWPTTTRLSVA
jgi:hypothetical protein